MLQREGRATQKNYDGLMILYRAGLFSHEHRNVILENLHDLTGVFNLLGTKKEDLFKKMLADFMANQKCLSQRPNRFFFNPRDTKEGKGPSIENAFTSPSPSRSN